MPSVNTITNFYVFSTGTVIRSAQVNANFSLYRGNLIPISPSTATAGSTGSYDLGSSDYAWRGVYSNFGYYTEQSTIPAAPPAGFRSIYAKSDGFYEQNSAGTESRVGTGGGGTGITQVGPFAFTANSAIFALNNSTSSASINAATYTSARYEYEVYRDGNGSSTSFMVNGQFTMQYYNGAWNKIGNEFEPVAPGVTFSFVQTSTIADIFATINNTAAGGGYVKIQKYPFTI